MCTTPLSTKTQYLITLILRSKGVPKTQPARRKVWVHGSRLAKVSPGSIIVVCCQVVAPNPKPSNCTLWILFRQPAHIPSKQQSHERNQTRWIRGFSERLRTDAAYCKGQIQRSAALSLDAAGMLAHLIFEADFCAHHLLQVACRCVLATCHP